MSREKRTCGNCRHSKNPVHDHESERKCAHPRIFKSGKILIVEHCVKSQTIHPNCPIDRVNRFKK